MAKKRTTGAVDVVLNGVTLLNKVGATATNIGRSSGGPVKRTPVMGDTGYHGHMEEPIPAECEVPITDREDVSLETIESINGDGTLIFRAKGGGKEYTMYNAVCAGEIETKSNEGETTLKFFGPAWIESTSSN